MFNFKNLLIFVASVGLAWGNACHRNKDKETCDKHPGHCLWDSGAGECIQIQPWGHYDGKDNGGDEAWDWYFYGKDNSWVVPKPSLKYEEPFGNWVPVQVPIENYSWKEGNRILTGKVIFNQTLDDPKGGNESPPKGYKEMEFELQFPRNLNTVSEGYIKWLAIDSLPDETVDFTADNYLQMDKEFECEVPPSPEDGGDFGLRTSWDQYCEDTKDWVPTQDDYVFYMTLDCKTGVQTKGDKDATLDEDGKQNCEDLVDDSAQDVKCFLFDENGERCGAKSRVAVVSANPTAVPVESPTSIISPTPPPSEEATDPPTSTPTDGPDSTDDPTAVPIPEPTHQYPTPAPVDWNDLTKTVSCIDELNRSHCEGKYQSDKLGEGDGSYNVKCRWDRQIDICFADYGYYDPDDHSGVYNAMLRMYKNLRPSPTKKPSGHTGSSGDDNGFMIATIVLASFIFVVAMVVLAWYLTYIMNPDEECDDSDSDNEMVSTTNKQPNAARITPGWGGAPSSRLF